MKTPEKVEWGFVNWLKSNCEIDIKNGTFKWKVMTETHIYKLMSTKKSL
jgi:hypothetical protein